MKSYRDIPYKNHLFLIFFYRPKLIFIHRWSSDRDDINIININVRCIKTKKGIEIGFSNIEKTGTRTTGFRFKQSKFLDTAINDKDTAKKYMTTAFIWALLFYNFELRFFYWQIA